MKILKTATKIGVVLAAFLIASLLLIQSAHASQTMDLVDEYRDGSKKVCVYSNGRNTVEVRKSGAGSCPSKHIQY